MAIRTCTIFLLYYRICLIKYFIIHNWPYNRMQKFYKKKLRYKPINNLKAIKLLFIWVESIVDEQNHNPKIQNEGHVEITNETFRAMLFILQIFEHFILSLFQHNCYCKERLIKTIEKPGEI